MFRFLVLLYAVITWSTRFLSATNSFLVNSFAKTPEGRSGNTTFSTVSLELFTVSLELFTDFLERSDFLIL